MKIMMITKSLFLGAKERGKSPRITVRIDRSVSRKKKTTWLGRLISGSLRAAYTQVRDKNEVVSFSRGNSR